MYRPLPDGLTIKKSPIEGLGLYATKNIKSNVIARFMYLISIKEIKTGDELTANYNLYTYPKTGVGFQTF